jgi:DNA repair protein RecN (Recombination protein N)
MLERLEVRSLGIIDSVVLEPSAGFVTLTGETGAGKSLLVESLKLIEGQRAQSDMVRSGDSLLRVEAWFTPPDSPQLNELLEELGIPAQESLVIRREVSANGRSRAWVNDVSTTATTLQRIAPFLLAIHGQHEQHGLADGAVQRRMVDEYGGHHQVAAQVSDAYTRWSECHVEVERLRQAQSKRRDRLDTISFQLGEIEAVEPQPGEDEELRQRRQVLRHAVRLAEFSSSVLGRLAEGDTATIDELARAEREVTEMVSCGLPLQNAIERLTDARIQMEEVVREIQSLSNGVEEDPSVLESVESRLHRLDQLMLKYGSPLEKVDAHRQLLLQERAELDAVEDRLGEAEAAAAKALAAYAEVAGKLAQLRQAGAGRMLTEVEKVLARLNMGGTRLELRWFTQTDDGSPLERNGCRLRFSTDGIEECELLISPNPGEELRPMARIASGGELSRIHLALRSVLRTRQSSSRLTLLFDEVDTGLGGSTAAALAMLLADLAATDQVMVVTHLPQVAARAVSHLRVEKKVLDGRATTQVISLADQARVEELARMLAGDQVEESALAHARSLLRIK